MNKNKGGGFLILKKLIDFYLKILLVYK